MTAPTTRRTRTDSEFLAWAEFRYQIRVWTGISERASRAVGLSPQHQQVLLQLRGFPSEEPPRIADLAERMQLRHHSMVGLLDRMEERDLVQRIPLGGGRGVSVVMTPHGEQLLAQVTKILRPQLRLAGRELIAALSMLVDDEPAAEPRARTTTSVPRTTARTRPAARPAARGTNGRAAH